MVITTIYARCSALERLELWNNLECLAEEINVPWVIGGDFNVIMNEFEELGGLPVTQQEVVNFAQCINNCGLSEINFTESLYTWRNKRIENDCIFKRLDRVLGNVEFNQEFPQSEVEHL